jgi:predicted  nucleic acid-binding Zn-ribbon protein
MFGMTGKLSAYRRNEEKLREEIARLTQENKDLRDTQETLADTIVFLVDTTKTLTEALKSGEGVIHAELESVKGIIDKALDAMRRRPEYDTVIEES